MRFADEVDEAEPTEAEMRALMDSLKGNVSRTVTPGRLRAPGSGQLSVGFNLDATQPSAPQSFRRPRGPSRGVVLDPESFRRAQLCGGTSFSAARSPGRLRRE